jgi:hypothetical protein
MRPGLVCASSLLIIACGPGGNEPPSVTGIVPLRVGSEWTYFIADSGEAKVYPDSTYIARIARDTLVGGLRWYFGDPAFLIAPGPSFHWLRNDVGGLYQSLPPYTVPLLAFSYPAVVGDFYLGGGWPLRVADADTVITVPAGTFHAVLYERVTSGPTGPGSVYGWLFVSPGVGLIKEIRPIRGNGSGQITVARIRVLTKYVP